MSCLKRTIFDLIGYNFNNNVESRAIDVKGFRGLGNRLQFDPFLLCHSVCFITYFGSAGSYHKSSLKRGFRGISLYYPFG